MPAPDAVVAFPASRDGLATRAQLAGAGISASRLKRDLAAGRVRRVHRGVYASSPLPKRAAHLVTGGELSAGYLAEVRAALLSLGPGAVADGRTAAILLGIDLYVEPRKIEVAVPESRGRASVEGVDVRRTDEVVGVERAVLGKDPLRVATAVEAVVSIAFRHSMRQAVVAADSAMRIGSMTVDQLRDAVVARAGAPRAQRLRRLVDLVDPRSGSVLESLLRFLLAQHGLYPSSQVVVRGRPGRIGRVDFAFLDARVVVECDGRRWHDPEDARRTDRWRTNELTRDGWRVLRVTWDLVAGSPAYVVALVRDTLLAAA